MTTYAATVTLSDGDYSRHIEAGDWAEAEAACLERGWRLEGVLVDPTMGSELRDIPYEE